MHRRLIAIPILALGLLAGCSSTSQPGPAAPPAAPKAPATHAAPSNAPSNGHQVTYKVTGTARTVAVTYTTQGTDTAQESGRSLPYTKTVSLPDDGFSFSYISAQNEGASGDVTCSIVIDGVVVKTNTSSGGYQICQVSNS